MGASAAAAKNRVGSQSDGGGKGPGKEASTATDHSFRSRATSTRNCRVDLARRKSPKAKTGENNFFKKCRPVPRKVPCVPEVEPVRLHRRAVAVVQHEGGPGGMLWPQPEGVAVVVASRVERTLGQVGGDRRCAGVAGEEVGVLAQHCGTTGVTRGGGGGGVEEEEEEENLGSVLMLHSVLSICKVQGN